MKVDMRVSVLCVREGAGERRTRSLDTVRCGVWACMGSAVSVLV